MIFKNKIHLFIYILCNKYKFNFFRMNFDRTSFDRETATVCDIRRTTSAHKEREFSINLLL